MLYSYKKDFRGECPKQVGHIGNGRQLGGFKGQKETMEAWVKLVEVGKIKGSRRPLGCCWLSKGFEFVL